MLFTTLMPVAVGACGGAAKGAAEPKFDPVASAAPPPALATQAKGLIEQYRQAWEVKSLDALSALYVRTVDVSLVVGGEALLGWTAIEERYKAALAASAVFKLRIEPVAVTAVDQGGVAVVAKVSRIYGDDVTKTEDRELVTFVLTPVEGKLAILVEHRSREAAK